MYRNSPTPKLGAQAESGAHSTTATFVTRWQAGDEAAFQALHQRFGPLLAMRVRRNRVWPLLEARFQVDDIVQDIWAQMIPAVGKSFEVSGSGSFLAFLSTIADRTMITLVRRINTQKRGDGSVAKTLIPDADQDVRASHWKSPTETPTSHARISELEAIAKITLSATEYEAWKLVELESYTADEAGLAMEKTGSSVRGLLLRGRAKLVVRLGTIEENMT